MTGLNCRHSPHFYKYIKAHTKCQMENFMRKNYIGNHHNFNVNGYIGSEKQRENARKGREKSVEIARAERIKRIELYNENPTLCKECGTPLEYEKRLNKFCCTSCAAKFNNKNRSKDSHLKISQSLKKSEKANKAIKALNENRTAKAKELYEKNPQLCVICNGNISYEYRHRKTCCDVCRSKLISINNIKNKNGGFKHKSIKYNDVYLDSSWELTVALSLDENEIKWVRPEGLYFYDRCGTQRRYHPDFYLPDYDVYLDPKNPFAMKVQKDKIEDVISYTNIKLLLLDKNELNYESILLKMVEVWGIEPHSPIV